MPAVQLLDAVGGLALQRRFHFLRYDASAEDAREGVTDGPLKLALETLNDPHGMNLAVVCSRSVCVSRLQSTRPLPLHDIRTPRPGGPASRFAMRFLHFYLHES
ncbi:hypothetical protein REA19_00290 [Prescottella equi]|nr:hypothetical protein REA19_00290 [Prescottella equi]